MTDAHDNISRKAAIEAVQEYLAAWDDIAINGSSLALVSDAIRAIPSVGVTEPTAKKWHMTDNGHSILLYTLKQDGWRKGEPVMVNDLMVRIENASRSEHDLKPIADRILAALDVQSAPLTPDVAALSALIVSVENGTAMNADFADAFPPIGPSKPYWTGTSAYNNGSLDAAKGFHNALLPGWDVQISTYEDDTFEASVSEPLNVKTYDGISPCMARAWLIAALRAALARKGG